MPSSVGDTIHIGKTKIRLHGIDAPEMKQECYRVDGTPYRCGEAATDALRVLIGVPVSGYTHIPTGDRPPLRAGSTTATKYDKQDSGSMISNRNTP